MRFDKMTVFRQYQRNNGRSGRTARRARFVAMALLVWANAVGMAAERLAPQIPPASPTDLKPSKGLFLVGHMHSETSDTSDGLTEDWFRRLQRFLEHDRALRAALERDGYSGVGMVAAEGFNDLVRRMEDPPGLDCVFCPALAYVRQLGDYAVVFQLKGPNDRGIGKYILHSGVIFVNSRHPLFRGSRAPDEQVPLRLIAHDFATSPVALLSSYSAAGYIYPCNELFKSGIRALPNQAIFCGSSEEVVKMVLSDVVGMGVCEQGAIEDVLKRYGIQVPADQVLDVLRTTPGAPTDPVVFRRRFLPAESDLGRRLKDALTRFFSSDRPGQIRLEDSDDGAFKGLRDAWNEFKTNTEEMDAVEAR